jgi:hypothetical protein
MAPFRYTTRLRGHTIRLIRLEPGDGKQVACSLEHVSLDNNPDYEAISYCWGKEQPSIPILCDGATLMVTRNLHDALHNFRCQNHNMRLWADAICINQADILEKNEQVPLMGSIYGQAQHVRVWLGPDEKETPKVAWAITTLSELARHNSKKLGIPLSSLAGSEYHDAWMTAAKCALEPKWRDLMGPHWMPFINFLSNP